MKIPAECRFGLARSSPFTEDEERETNAREYSRRRGRQTKGWLLK